MTNFLFKILFIFIIFYLTGNFDLSSAFCDNSEIISDTEMTQKPQEINGYLTFKGILMFATIAIIVILINTADNTTISDVLQQAAVNTLKDRLAGVDNSDIYEITGYPEEKGE